MHTSRRMLIVAAALLTLPAAACSVQQPGATADPVGGGAKHLKVVATTGYLGDVVQHLAPDAELTVLVGPGGDPHTQSLTTGDAQRLQAADLVVWTSHDMEHHMMDQLEGLGAKQVAAGEAVPKDLLLPWEEDGKVEGNDPHVWNSPEGWTHVVNATAKKLGEIDAPNAAKYMEGAKRYNDEILAAKEEAAKEFAAIPKERRVLVTGHDAFNYLGKTFDLEIHATDFVSSEAQMSAAQIDELAQLVATKKVGVIFQDNLSNPDAITHLKEAVKAKGWSVEIADTPLYADSLGDSAPTNTYLGAFKHNVKQIAAAFRRGGQ